MITKRKIPNSEITRIINLYQQERLSTHAIARHYDVAAKTIWYLLREHKVQLRDRHEARRAFNPEEEKYIAQEYQQGKSSGELANRYGVSGVTILQTLKKLGIARRGSFLANRRYPINDHAFDQITDTSAYWAGFLMADGYINGNILQVGLSQKDKSHLIKLRAFLDTESRPIYEYKVKSYDVVMLKIRSKILTGRLGELGVVRRKSFTAIVSNELELCPMFWLGVIDGDGTLTVKRDLPLLIFHSGSKALVIQYVAFLKTRFFLDFTPAISQRKSVYRVALSGKRAYQVIRELYNFSPVSLDRKREKAESILENYKSRYNTK